MSKKITLPFRRVSVQNKILKNRYYTSAITEANFHDPPRDGVLYVGFVINSGNYAGFKLKTDLNPKYKELIKKYEIDVSLQIQIPLSGQTRNAQARTIWIKKDLRHPQQYIIGLSYSRIAAADNKYIVRYAWTRYILPRLSASAIVLMLLSVAVTAYLNWMITKHNQDNVVGLLQLLDDSKIAQEAVCKISKEKWILELLGSL